MPMQHAWGGGNMASIASPVARAHGSTINRPRPISLGTCDYKSRNMIAGRRAKMEPDESTNSCTSTYVSTIVDDCVVWCDRVASVSLSLGFFDAML